MDATGIDACAFDALLAGDQPLLDVRAPIEYAAGTLPAATSLPLLDDEERRQVGIRYKQQGQAAAIELGHALVGGDVRARRTEAWCAFVDRHPAALLYCWRGGLRSQTVQAWLHDAGRRITRIDGGYKALRQLAMARLTTIVDDPRPWCVLGGRTGSGKTVLLGEFAAAVDLEGIARHRGSAFGYRLAGQPTQVDFEHGLLRALLQRLREPAACLLFEDESRMVGRVALPEPLHLRLKRSPIVVLDVPREERAAHIAKEYVHEALAELVILGSPTPLAALQSTLGAALDRIERRLGGVKHAEIRHMLDDAFARHERGDAEGHLAWVDALLEHYYDPMYDYQLGQHTERIVFRGARSAVREWLTKQLA